MDTSVFQQTLFILHPFHQPSMVACFKFWLCASCPLGRVVLGSQCMVRYLCTHVFVLVFFPIRDQRVSSKEICHNDHMLDVQ